MKIDKIDINIRDNRLYYLVALFLDRPEVLGDIVDLREKWQIEKYKKILANSDDWYDAWTEILKNEKIVEVNLDTINPQLLIPEKQRNDSVISSKMSDLDPSWASTAEYLQVTKFLYDCKLLRCKYNKTFFFDDVIPSAVVVNRISDKDAGLAYGEIIYPNEPWPVFKFSKMAIIFYPEASEKDVVKAFREYRKELIQEYSEQFPIDTSLEKLKAKTISNIKRDRRWYWIYKKFEKQIDRKEDIYMTIAKIEEKKLKRKLSEIELFHLSDKIRKAIKQYIKHFM